MTLLSSPCPPLIGDAAPEFSCRTTMGERSLSGYRGRWLVLFSHPADFTPVCTSEIVAFAKAWPEFQESGCDLLGLSVDSLFSHVAWVRAIQARFGITVPFPLAEDPSMAVARAFGMLSPQAGHAGTVRSCFIIDPEGVIRLVLTYPMSVGRSVSEILRALHALQVSDRAGVMLPEGWQPGEPVIGPVALDAADGRDASEWLFATTLLEPSA